MRDRVFCNAYAAANGKHIGILRPNNGGIIKGFHSIVIFAFIGYNYHFLVAQVSCQRRTCDGAVYRNSDFHSASQKGALNFPDLMSLPKNPDR